MRNTKHVRARPEDAKKLESYSKLLRESNPDVLHRILNSKELDLDNRILVEAKKKDEELIRRMRR